MLSDMLSITACNATSYHFRDICDQTAKIDVWEDKNGPPETIFDPILGDP